MKFVVATMSNFYNEVPMSQLTKQPGLRTIGFD